MPAKKADPEFVKDFVAAVNTHELDRIKTELRSLCRRLMLRTEQPVTGFEELFLQVDPDGLDDLVDAYLDCLLSGLWARLQGNLRTHDFHFIGAFVQNGVSIGDLKLERRPPKIVREKWGVGQERVEEIEGIAALTCRCISDKGLHLKLEVLWRKPAWGVRSQVYGKPKSNDASAGETIPDDQ